MRLCRRLLQERHRSVETAAHDVGEPDVVAHGPRRLSVSAAGLTVGARVAVSIRPHDIALGAPDDVNAFRRVVQRVGFLGEDMDYPRFRWSTATSRCT
jgi:hypothetical protein